MNPLSNSVQKPVAPFVLSCESQCVFGPARVA